jgi:RNA methyltransferase, TrmH family
VADDPPARVVPDLIVLTGVHAVKHAVRFGAVIERLTAADPAAARALMAVVAPDVVLGPIEVGDGELVAHARRPSGGPTGKGPAVLLDNPRNLGNVGAVVRVAAGFGARAVLTTGTVDPWHPTVVRAAAGLHWAVSVARVSSLPAEVIAFDPAGDDLRDARIPDDAVLAFGSERHGLSADVLARATQVLRIPIRDQVSSYNLATSVAVGLYAWSAAG